MAAAKTTVPIDCAVREFAADGHQITAARLWDGEGNSPDWIELYNAGDQTAHLEGYRLADDPGDRDKWRFPDVDLDPGQYLVVFA